MDSKLRKFLESDRQWLRPHRIAHARFQLDRAITDEDREFWKAVLRANAKEIE